PASLPWPGIALPALTGLDVHGAEFPLLQRVVNPHHEAKLLLVISDREPILDQSNPRSHQHAFKLGCRTIEFLHVPLTAKSHHSFETRAVVPAAPEQHDL